MVYFMLQSYNNFIKLEVIETNHKIPNFSFINQHNDIVIQDS